MRFPEWTIWAVPLTAHELGQVVIKEADGLLEEYVRSQIRRNKTKQQHMRVLLADAFATYVMGPAYACSAILLRFNPRAAHHDRGMYPSDAKRAYVVLSMLKKMYKKDAPVLAKYGDILEKLETAWNAALVNGQTTVKGAPSHNEEQLDLWTSFVMNELSNAYAMYEGNLWDTTYDALELLLRNEVPKDKLAGQEEWRDVLNAAWAYRINKPDEYHNIARQAEELWQLIEDKKSKITVRKSSPTGLSQNYIFAVPDKKYVKA
jgi:hypothetical protein